MNLDELQTVQSRERQTDSLQQLRETFYEDAGEFIQQLRSRRDRAADEAEDPFDSPEVNRLTDDIKTAEQTVEAIYERRVGKVVKMASLAAADMPTEEEGLTREERDLFETLVGSIEDNREHVLDVLAGEASPGSVTGGASSDERPTEPTSEAAPAATDDTARSDPAAASPPDRVETGAEATGAPDGDAEAATATTDDPAAPDQSPGTTVDAADVMGAGTDESAAPPEEVPPDSAPPGRESDTASADPEPDGGVRGRTPEDGGGATPADGPDVDRRTVRITDDVGEILGVDQREYDLSSDDVVTLPAANADPLVERDAAERLD